MNSYFLAAAALALSVGLIHSVLGEFLIFQRMRKSGLVPTDGGSVLQERHVRILWASWHVITVLGCVIAATLYWLATPQAGHASPGFLVLAIFIGMLGSSALVLVGTNGKHPGWIGLLGVAVLVWLGS